jgi:hypothetical protein
MERQKARKQQRQMEERRHEAEQQPKAHEGKVMKSIKGQQRSEGVKPGNNQKHAKGESIGGSESKSQERRV